MQNLDLNSQGKGLQYLDEYSCFCNGKEVATSKSYLVLDRTKMAVGLVHSSLLDRAEVGVDPVVEDPRMRVVTAIRLSPNQRDPAIRFMILCMALATHKWDLALELEVEVMADWCLTM
ncbi:hypothetical protein GUJ93_ZPchr0184g33704 [Zizania palustris]|uniref:Uncharacterized protein n=1 Tax=Zizania palustris TaxID=103762 RepID=A0A8J5QUQ6_ZIZPA|nr:hypothetical protein GUJ93_ZPchr0184g33705 [Zizania palustris]KAG8036312.1 hypothetical protein GUJ93_ZPchr0184g33704 [Zizania palustris]